MEAMKQHDEEKHLNKLWQKMKRHFKKFTHTQDAEALHQFRVQVKKIRSFLTLLEASKKNEGLQKIFRPVKKIFKSAGVIRDAYLHQKQAQEHRIKQGKFYTRQDALQKGETAKLIRKSEKHLQKMKAVKKDLYKQLHPVTNKEIKTFYQSSIAATQQILARDRFTEQLHEGRKILKHLMYNQHAISDDLTSELNLNFTYIDKLQDLLGQWHDTKLALSFFGKKLDAKALQSMKEKRAQLQKQITNQATDFDKKILANPHSA
jgi:CHAD domain-containing protein